MARRTKEDAQLTRDAILDAAEQVFRDKGVARTRMEDIAHSANCTRGAIYWHFKNKTDVLLAMSERIIMPLYDSITHLLATPQADPLGVWRGHLLESVQKIEIDSQQQNACDILINRCEMSSELEPLRQLERQRSEFFVDSTRRMLERAQAAGQIRPDADLTTAALAMHGITHGLIMLWLRQGNTFPLRCSVASSIDLLLHGIRQD